MKNQRPSSLPNLGEDISGAARHNNETYDNPDRDLKKKSVKQRNELKAKALIDIKTALEPIAIIERFELDSFCQAFNLNKADNVQALKALVISIKTEREDFNELAKAFNRMSRRIRKAKYSNLESQRCYFDKKSKDTFHEKNGLEKPWATTQASFDLALLKPILRGLQFGNSVTDNERLYCSMELKESLDIVSKHFDFDTSKIGFAFGSRGKAGSVAHYDPSMKTLAFNRGWIGAFAHELGHAIDDSLNRPSRAMPYEIKTEYLAKIKNNPNRQYYSKNSEIFARMFEMYCFETLNIRNEFFVSIFDSSVMPELTDDVKAWLLNSLKPIIKAN